MARTNTRRMHALRQAFFEDGARLDTLGDDSANCWICKRKIDYAAAPGTTEASHNLDHYLPVSTHPHLQEDPSNFRHAHKACNGLRGANAPSIGLGEPVPDWWD